MSKAVSDVKKIYSSYALTENNYQNIEKESELESCYKKWNFIPKVVEDVPKEKENDCSVRKEK